MGEDSPSPIPATPAPPRAEFTGDLEVQTSWHAPAGRPARFPGHASVAALLLVGLILGCDCAHKAQFQIRPSDDVLADTTDRRRVADVVTDAATKVGLADHTGESLEPGTIAFYREPLPRENPRGLWVGARSAGGQVVIDMEQWNPGCEKSKRAKFNRLLKLTNAGLSEAFGERVVLTKDPSRMVKSNQAGPTNGSS